MRLKFIFKIPNFMVRVVWPSGARMSFTFGAAAPSFGAAPAASPFGAAPANLFGAPPAPANPFGAPAASPAPFGFGAPAAAPQTSSLFAPAAAPSPFGFAQPQAQLQLAVGGRKSCGCAAEVQDCGCQPPTSLQLPPNVPFSHSTKWADLPAEVQQQLLAIECVPAASLSLASA
jgi:hypothetical protein